MSIEEKIRANAQLAINTFGPASGLGTEFGYNRISVEWVEGFIERQRSRTDITPDKVARLVQVIGSYLGECVICTYGGVWRETNGSWGVFFDERDAVFPFNKVQKQFEKGLESGDSVLGFFDLIDVVFFKEP
jgi:hypothetical protein